MKFKDIYNETISLWPVIIDISDGTFINENGFRSSFLSESWDKAEELSEGDWQDLMLWVMYQAFHTESVKRFRRGDYIFNTRDVNKRSIKKRYIEALKDEEYIDMLNKFEG